MEAALLRYPMAWAVVLTAVVGIAFLVSLSPSYETNDDVAMQAVVEGSLGEPLPHLVFSNVLLGQLLSGLYHAVGWFPWYGVYLYLAHLAALLALVYVVLSVERDDLRVRLFALAGVVAVFHMPMWMQLQFTSTAILLGLSGAVLYVATAQRARAHWIALTAAGAMVGFSFWIRWSSGQAALLLGLPIMVFAARRIPWRRQALFAGIAAVVVLIGSVGQALYYRDHTDWHAYFEFNSVRGQLHQPAAFSQLDAAAAAEVGWSRNDLRMFRYWFFADEDVYETADLEALASALPTSFRLDQAIRSLADQGTGWPGVLRLAVIGSLALLVWVRSSSRARAAVVISLLTVGSVLFVVAGLAKLPARVALPVLAFPALLFLATPCTNTQPESANANRPRRALLAFTILVFVAALAVGVLHSLKKDGLHQQGAAYLDRVMSQLEGIDPEGLFISWGTQLPRNGQTVSPLQRGGTGEPRLVSLGWQQRSPMHRAMLASRGIGDLYVAIASRDDVYLPLRDPELGSLYLRYLQEHYGFSGLLRPVARVGEYQVYDLAVDYQIDDRADLLVERHLDGSSSAHPLSRPGPEDRATVLPRADGSLLISGRTTADLIVVTNRTRAVALVLPHDLTDESDPNIFAVSLRPAPRVLRVFAVYDDLAAEITP